MWPLTLGFETRAWGLKANAVNVEGKECKNNMFDNCHLYCRLQITYDETIKYLFAKDENEGEMLRIKQ